MKRNITLAAITAAAIAASAIVPTSSAFAAEPHYKPLICIFLPSLDVCAPPKPVMHHHMMMMKKKP